MADFAKRPEITVDTMVSLTTSIAAAEEDREIRITIFLFLRLQP